MSLAPSPADFGAWAVFAADPADLVAAAVAVPALLAAETAGLAAAAFDPVAAEFAGWACVPDLVAAAAVAASVFVVVLVFLNSCLCHLLGVLALAGLPELGVQDGDCCCRHGAPL